MTRICIAGAGFSGAVIARKLAEAGIASLVIDERSHVAGNCHTERDPRTGVLVHRYGPHIFHTSDAEVWAYVNRFAEMVPYVNRVKATVRGRVYSLPINLHTINQFFGTAMGPEQARRFLAARARTDIEDPQTFEEQALRFVGKEIYRAFFEGYTRKQWGCEPSELPASILKRLPLRFNYDDNYFDHRWQAMPRHGYTALIARILDHPLIETRLRCRYEELEEGFGHTFYSGPIDRFFNWRAGRLGYRTLDFEAERGEGDMQGCAVMNHPDRDTPWTRISEHKHFAPWEAGEITGSIRFREYARACGADDIPYYPIRLVEEKAMLRRYEEMAAEVPGVTFVGRLGTYSYIDMDVTIRRALDVADVYLERQRAAA
ncbi:UDP-galactopyranose/dTDP-fucopyranose mutase family protein [Rhodovulum sp. DZ06]|uniref:UDP-galactopyranose/dTDP-fucopyranose mutase family protein n=1 Tax=Rhodovulum sp. DZ06 TaxID=3425126 RepID=UPI003D356E15